ncbi:helix-turn-helix domain-containing protein [Streptomyces sp. I05A-00742]|uniref:helix-turn-helix domain-containing protein n=1 Tax=Streptomyces sp. I05A-00742 TaxID=2732853 RepID=UPI00148902B3|nr:helix-turn-helix transcriptional regulator [Streptomyces sp. I05A-00742]
MDTPAELGEFLRTRRAALRPEDIGLATYGGQRRVPGLRREELARLAGVSVAYYTRLEQGQSGNASDGVLDALARALRLSPDEHAHLRNLARPVRPAHPERRAAARPARVRPGVRQLVAAMGDVPAVVLDHRYDVLDWNPLGHALIAGHLDADAPHRPAARPNSQRLLFLDPHARELYPRWGVESRRAVSALRLAAGEHPDDQQLAALVGELTMKSPEFAALWARHPVRACTSGTKELHHPLVGAVTLSFEMLRAPAADGTAQSVLAFSAEPGSPSEAALRLLSTTLAAAPPPPVVPERVEHDRQGPTVR